jgi:hypothetical protein
MDSESIKTFNSLEKDLAKRTSEREISWIEGQRFTYYIMTFYIIIFCGIIFIYKNEGLKSSSMSWDDVTQSIFYKENESFRCNGIEYLFCYGQTTKVRNNLLNICFYLR